MAAFGGRGCRCPPTGAGRAHGEGDCRGLPAETKGGKGTVWFPFPLLTPPNPPLRRDAFRLRGETGVTGARFRASSRLWDAVMP